MRKVNKISDLTIGTIVTLEGDPLTKWKIVEIIPLSATVNWYIDDCSSGKIRVPSTLFLVKDIDSDLERLVDAQSITSLEYVEEVVFLDAVRRVLNKTWKRAVNSEDIYMEVSDDGLYGIYTPIRTDGGGIKLSPNYIELEKKDWREYERRQV